MTSRSLTVDELIALWKKERWGTHISMDGLVSHGADPEDLIEAIQDGRLGAFTSGLSSADYGVTYCCINDPKDSHDQARS